MQSILDWTSVMKFEMCQAVQISAVSRQKFVIMPRLVLDFHSGDTEPLAPSLASVIIKP